MTRRRIATIFQLILLVSSILLLPIITEAASNIPWTTEWYAVGAYNFTEGNENYANSSANLPIIASLYGGSIYSEITASTTSVSSYFPSTYSEAEADVYFVGNYVANAPYFMFQYDYDHTAGYTFFDLGVAEYRNNQWYQWLGNISCSSDCSGTLLAPTPVGGDIRVTLEHYALSDRNGSLSSSSLNYYSMSSVAPEPLSSVLFVTGGTLLAGRRFIRRKA